MMRKQVNNLLIPHIDVQIVRLIYVLIPEPNHFLVSYSLLLVALADISSDDDSAASAGRNSLREVLPTSQLKQVPHSNLA